LTPDPTVGFQTIAAMRRWRDDAIDPQRTSPSLAHCDAAIRYGVRRELVVSRHLVDWKRGLNETARVHYPYRRCGCCMVKPSASPAARNADDRLALLGLGTFGQAIDVAAAHSLNQGVQRMASRSYRGA
jgi:hypothetical protein